jgi:hypothetical protein
VERGAVRGGHGHRGRSRVVAILGQHDGATRRPEPVGAPARRRPATTSANDRTVPSRSAARSPPSRLLVRLPVALLGGAGHGDAVGPGPGGTGR